MSVVKSKLRAARDALDKQEYSKAKESALDVLAHDTGNYNAHVFLGLALFELGEVDYSEQVLENLHWGTATDILVCQTYKRAIELQPVQILAWQGLSRLYERMERWQEYVQSLYHIVDLLAAQNDAIRCAETLQKIMDVCRKESDLLELVKALSLLLPDSRIYAVLSTLPPPDNSSPTPTTINSIQRAVFETLPLLQEISSLLEGYEEDVFKKEIENRKTRLGAPDQEQLRKLVGKDIWGSSHLPLIYSEIINHPESPDNLRRETESKLLRYKNRHLRSLTNDEISKPVRDRLLSEMDDLIQNAILLRIPDVFAWDLSLEQEDAETLAACDPQLIREYVKLFPDSPTAILLLNFFSYMELDLWGSHIEADEVLPDSGRAYTVILDTYSKISDTIIANRALAEVYLKEEDYENAWRIADHTLSLLEIAEREIGVHLRSVNLGIKAIKAHSLVYLYPPNYHDLASAIISNVLSQCPTNVTCLLGRASILQAEENWGEARAVYLQVAELLPKDAYDRLRSVEEAAWCYYQCGYHQDALASLQRTFTSFKDLSGRESDRARCLWKIGQCYWYMNAESRQESFQFYVASLKQDPMYAPTFTSLGIYYSESPSPDPMRATKCFQKAFELDPRQGEAARRLAESFAVDQEWDLVDVIARRTIEAVDGTSRIQLPDMKRVRWSSSWVWKAIGVVELTRGNYLDSIKAFQTALSSDANDGVLWSWLGETYSKSGRYAAAMKALKKAEDLIPGDWSCQYSIANLKRNTGDFQDAISIYTTLLASRPDEPVVLVSLIQSHLELARVQHSEGFQERAEKSFITTIQLASKAIQENRPRAFCWKLLADALFYLAVQPQYHCHAVLRETLAEVVDNLTCVDVDDDLTCAIPRPNLAEGHPVNRKQVLLIALMAYHDQTLRRPAGGSQWYDVAIALQNWASTSSASQHTVTNKSVSYLRRALQGDVRDHSFWAALGTVHFLTRPMLAQHAYIRALEIDIKNVVNWSRLGLLYLHCRDLDLANKTFIHARTLDPDNALSWVGLAFIRLITGCEAEARELLSHTLSLNPKTEIYLEFAHSSFRQSAISSGRLAQHLIAAFFALHHYHVSQLEDSFALHMFGLVNESLGLVELAGTLVQKAASLLEAEYEDTEDPLLERCFATATYNLARIRLAQLDVTGAVDSFRDVLGLLAEDNDIVAIDLRARAHIGHGLANFMLLNPHPALESFEAALENAHGNFILESQATILLAQAMWSVGSGAYRNVAKTRLLQCIASDPLNVTAIMTLVAMGVLSNDEALIDAALSELLDMPTEQRHQLDPDDTISNLLVQQHLSKGEHRKAFMFAQRTLHAVPFDIKARNRLATVALQQGHHEVARAILSCDQEYSTEDPSAFGERLCLLAAAHTLGDSPGKKELGLRAAQKAIMLLPNSSRSWQTLALVRSRSVSLQ